MVRCCPARAQADAAAGLDGGQDRRLLPLVVKADVQGSAEAVCQAVEQMSSDQVSRPFGPVRSARSCLLAVSSLHCGACRQQVCCVGLVSNAHITTDYLVQTSTSVRQFTCCPRLHQTTAQAWPARFCKSAIVRLLTC